MTVDIGMRVINAYISLIKMPISFLGKRRHDIFLSHISEKIAPIVTTKTSDGEIKFYCSGVLPEFRARTLLTKEPDTIKWIDAFSAGDIFWDIGANIGCYTLYAASRGIQTFAFEPNASNYSICCKNIIINKFTETATAYCIAFSEKNELSYLNLSTLEQGGAVAMFGKESDAITISGEGHEFHYRQGAIGYSIDAFVSQNSEIFPNHIKIDVDGIEDKILAGGTNTLKDDRLKSVLIEIDESNIKQKKLILQAMSDANFSSTTERPVPFPNNTYHGDVRNYIFIKNSARLNKI